MFSNVVKVGALSAPSANADAPLRFREFELHPNERMLRVNGEPMALGSRAFDLLLALAQRHGRLVTKQELLDLVWPGVVVEEHNIATHISTLRKLLGARAVATVPGQGYRLTAPQVEAFVGTGQVGNTCAETLVALFPSSLAEFVMPWRSSAVIDQKEEFVRLASTGGINFSQLCLRYDISRKTGYKWLARWTAGCGSSRSLLPLSSRPHSCPMLTEASLQRQVLELRTSNPAWGGRKIAHVVMRDHGLRVAPSTVTGILHRHGLISEPAQLAASPSQRVEPEAPNRMWQMDFSGLFATDTVRCHTLTVLDDHSQFNLLLRALGNERFESVQACLSDVFRRYGLPEHINADTGALWGTAGQLSGVTRLALWLIRLGITLSYSRPQRPQANGKDERFHLTLKAEVLDHRHFRDLSQLQHHFDRWRHRYNCQRPHSALHMSTPAQRYAPSPRTMPDPLPTIEYAPDRIVRKVQAAGLITFKGQTIRLSPELRGLPVALVQHQADDGAFDVYFCHQRIDRIYLAELR